MKTTSLILPATAFATLIALSLSASAAAPSNEELMKKIEELTKTVTDLKAKVQANATTAKPAATGKPDAKAADKTAAKKKAVTAEEQLAERPMTGTLNEINSKKNSSASIFKT